MIHIPTGGRNVRLLAIGYGIMLFVWVTLEDNAIWPVSLLGLGLAILIVYLTIIDKINGQLFAVRWLPFIGIASGGLIGLTAGLCITGLMFFKNAVHAHVFLDFPLGLMLAMLQRTPSWTAVGALLGLGSGLGWMAFMAEKNT